MQHRTPKKTMKNFTQEDQDLHTGSDEEEEREMMNDNRTQDNQVDVPTQVPAVRDGTVKLAQGKLVSYTNNETQETVSARRCKSTGTCR